MINDESPMHLKDKNRVRNWSFVSFNNFRQGPEVPMEYQALVSAMTRPILLSVPHKKHFENENERRRWQNAWVELDRLNEVERNAAYQGKVATGCHYLCHKGDRPAQRQELRPELDVQEQMLVVLKLVRESTHAKRGWEIAQVEKMYVLENKTYLRAVYLRPATMRGDKWPEGWEGKKLIKWKSAQGRLLRDDKLDVEVVQYASHFNQRTWVLGKAIGQIVFEQTQRIEKFWSNRQLDGLDSGLLPAIPRATELPQLYDDSEEP